MDKNPVTHMPADLDYDQVMEALVRKIARGNADADDRRQYEELSLRRSIQMRSEHPYFTRPSKVA